MFIPKLLIFIPALRNEFLRPCDRSQRAARLLEKSKLLYGKWSGLVDTVDLDPVSRAGDVESPVPRCPDGKRLGVEGVIPDSTDDLDPSFNIARQVDGPRSPRPFSLLRQVLKRDSVPTEATVC